MSNKPITFLTPIVTEEQNSKQISALVDAIQQQYSIGDEYAPADVELLSGYINRKGIPYDVNCKHTDFVPVIPGEKIKIYAYSYINGYAYAFYRENNYDSLESIYPKSSTSALPPLHLSGVEVVVPNNAYWAVASYAGTETVSPTKVGIWKHCSNIKSFEQLSSNIVSAATVQISALSSKVATADDLGNIKIGYVQNGQNYPVQLSDDKAYVNVPWVDVAVQSAWYDVDSKKIIVQFNDSAKDKISVDVADLVNTYVADETTLTLSGNQFSVKAGVFQKAGDFVSSATLNDYYTKSETSSFEQISSGLNSIQGNIDSALSNSAAAFETLFQKMPIYDQNDINGYEIVSADCISGYLMYNGQINGVAGYWTTMPIEVFPGELLMIDAVAGSSVRAYALYDKDMEFLEAFPPGSESLPSQDFIYYAVEVPENARYVRICQKNNIPSVRKLTSNQCGIEQIATTPLAYEDVTDSLSDLVITGYVGRNGAIYTTTGKMLSGSMDRFEGLYATGHTSQSTTFLVATYENADGAIKNKSIKTFFPKNATTSPAFVHRLHLTEKNIKNLIGIDNVLSIGICNYDARNGLPLIEKAIGEQNINSKIDIAKHTSNWLFDDIVESAQYDGPISASARIEDDSGYILTANGFDCTYPIDIVPNRKFVLDLVVSDRYAGYAIYSKNGKYLENGGVDISATASTVSNDYAVDGLTVDCNEILNKFGDDASKIVFSSKYGKLSTLQIIGLKFDTYQTLHDSLDAMNDSISDVSATVDKTITFDYGYEDVSDQFEEYKIKHAYLQASKITIQSSGPSYVLSGPIEAFEGLYFSGSTIQQTRLLAATYMQDGQMKFKSADMFKPATSYSDAKFINRFPLTMESICEALSIDNVLSIALGSYNLDNYKVVLERRIKSISMNDVVHQMPNEIQRIFSDVSSAWKYEGDLLESKALKTGSGNQTSLDGYQTTEYIPLVPNQKFILDYTIKGNYCAYGIYGEDHRCLYTGGSNLSAVNYADLTANDYIVSGFELDTNEMMSKLGNDAKYVRFSSNYGQLSTLSVSGYPYTSYDSLKGIKGEIQSEISGEVEQKIDDAIDSLRDDILSAHLYNMLADKRWLACGDSFTQGDFSGYIDKDGHTGRNSDAYDPVLGMYKTYPWFIATHNGMKLSNVAVCGGTMHYNGNDPINFPRNHFVKRLDDLSSQISAADYITFMYGINEQNGTKYLSSVYDANSNKTLASKLENPANCPLSDYADVPLSDLNREPYASVQIPGVNYGLSTDSTPATIWGAWNITLSNILSVNPDVKLGIILCDGSLGQQQYDTQKAIAEWWGIPVLDMKGNPNSSLYIGSKLGVETNSYARQQRSNVFKVSSSNGHPGLIGHEYRSTVIENFLRTL